MKILVTALFLIFATAVWAGVVKEEELTFAPTLAEELGLSAYGKGDLTKAASLFKKGAERGDSYSQLHLGVMYERGKGVLQDYAEAVRWYKLSAKQGHSSAQYNLGLMYDEGKGVQDYLKAHMWMNLASASASASASGDKYAQSRRDFIAEKMTSQQITKAQEMAKKCLASQLKDCD